MKQPKLSDQVKNLEARVQYLEGQIGRIRGTLTVNFCDYEGRIRPNPNPLWTVEELQRKDISDAVFEAMVYINDNALSKLSKYANVPPKPNPKPNY